MPPLELVREEVAALMAAFRAGDSAAGARLIELFYPELVRIKALPPQAGERNNEKAAFFALAGQIMRRLLIHHARPLSSKAQKVPLWDEMDAGETSLVEVEDILTRLGAIKPAIRTVVEMKVFEGLTAEEIALHLGCAAVTVNRYWQFARHWLRKEWTGAEAF
jgi:DNA-directed RNA polymerase specialized sigma24 family protein